MSERGGDGALAKSIKIFCEKKLVMVSVGIRG